MYEEKIATCTRASLVFNVECSFALVLDFRYDDNKHCGFSPYITEYSELKKITEILNKNETGFAKDAINNHDLQKLIGKKAKILSGGIGNDSHFMYFIEESKK